MIITGIRAQNVRKIRVMDLEPGPGFNFIWGANGGGKTSFLEVLHYLNAAKSFRTHRFDELVSRGQHWFGVSGEVAPSTESNAEKASIRIVREKETTRITVNRIPVTSAAGLASRFPLLVLEPHSFDIVEGGPKVRRSLLDRTVFHVEPDFITTSRAYHQALANRNAVLKHGGKPSELEFWSRELALYGEALDAARQRCVDFLNARLALDIPLTQRLGTLSLKYRRGWREGSSLAESLASHHASELQAGQTLSGPHKAELSILSAGEALSRIGSRGQFKALVTLLVCSLVAYIHDRSEMRAVLLVDDFSAELDDEMRGIALTMLRSSGAQVFLTTVHEFLARDALETGDYLFHVEHGEIQRPS